MNFNVSKIVLGEFYLIFQSLAKLCHDNIFSILKSQGNPYMDNSKTSCGCELTFECFELFDLRLGNLHCSIKKYLYYFSVHEKFLVSVFWELLLVNTFIVNKPVINRFAVKISICIANQIPGFFIILVFD